MGIPGLTTPRIGSAEIRKGCGSVAFSKNDTVGIAVVLSGLSEIAMVSPGKTVSGILLSQMLQLGPGSR